MIDGRIDLRDLLSDFDFIIKIHVQFFNRPIDLRPHQDILNRLHGSGGPHFLHDFAAFNFTRPPLRLFFFRLPAQPALPASNTEGREYEKRNDRFFHYSIPMMANTPAFAFSRMNRAETVALRARV